jgi:NADPH:quinone reductase-like Zn-dependent oxidoreductase
MTALGGPEVLELQEVERPEPIPTEVLVRVTAAGINPVDWKTRQHGGFQSAVGDPPLILGWDVAGVVEEVDPDVTRFAPGDRVFGMPWFPRVAAAYAEYVTSPARQLARTPDALSDEEAGGLPLAGLTAWQALVDVAEVGEGTRVLVHAAAGGVGHLAVQIAKARGAHVIGTAREDKHDFLRELGVDEPIDYTAQPFEEAVSDVDVVFDLIAGEEYGLRSLKTLREGGLWLCIPADVPDAVAKAAGEQSKRALSFLVEPDYAGLEALAALTN